MNMRPETDRHINNILDCFTGADGGVAFFKLKVLLEDLDAQAAAGDVPAGQLIGIVTAFSRLIDVATKS